MTITATHISSILQGLASERWPTDLSQPEDPTQAWAGECGLFVDAAWQRLEAAGVTFTDEGLIGKFSHLNCPIEPPPGLTLEKVSSLGIEQRMNHHWIYSGGLHFDAASPQGVAGVFELRCNRQLAVEVLQADHPEVLAELCGQHKWWRDSAELLADFMSERLVAESATRPVQREHP